MRIVTWNVRRAIKSSDVWRLISDINPDVALLQEVSSIPDNILSVFDIKFERATNKSGQLQKFGTAILVKGKIINNLELSSVHDWVNKELEFFSGNIISCTVKLAVGPELNVISVYSPAWPVEPARIKDIDVSDVKLKKDSKVWMTEILWSALKSANLKKGNWIVGGDLNSSETFDLTWASGGNKEILDRMNTLGFKECLKEYKGKLIPTFKNIKQNKIAHQLDHLFVTNNFYKNIKTCTIGNKLDIFEKSFSDHLPIIADFK